VTRREKRRRVWCEWREKRGLERACAKKSAGLGVTVRSVVTGRTDAEVRRDKVLSVLSIGLMMRIEPTGSLGPIIGRPAAEPKRPDDQS
jgi:hypothetical protein